MRIDWKSIDFDWNRAKAFLATAELGSLSAAAKALSCSQPTLSRQVNGLEEELKVALFPLPLKSFQVVLPLVKLFLSAASQ